MGREGAKLVAAAVAAAAVWVKVTCDVTAEAALAHSLARSILRRFVMTANCKLRYSPPCLCYSSVYDAAGKICLERWRRLTAGKVSPLDFPC